MTIVYLNINDLISKQPLEKWLDVLPKIIQDDVLKYKKEKDRWRVLGGKLLLKNMLKKKQLNYSLDELAIGDKGKPYFKSADFDFNISHSGDLVVIVFSENGRVGVDIEMHRKIGFLNFEDNFTASEWQTIINAADQSKQFFDYWAIKESIIKADGRGFEVLRKSAIYPPSKATCDGKEYHIATIFIEKQYSSCVCSNKKISVIEIERIYC